MNFEKVELYGFKSFADKAEIKFGNGITGIVGPNGCGKSNVADAIRWVLGEQSAKSLRGSSMQDVIFAGTQNRKSLSYCEVSLFFDNTNRIFDLDYNEVIITRKLYRSGESEYFINKQQARLKDIVDLLRECGIGKEGYTIIGQGKVEEIMSAKPEDRRVIFEEATGIAKFKSRKVESERKLERTRENIVRYSDILSEIENRLEPLERQAEKAKEFNELSEQLKFHELNTYVAKVDGVAAAKERINDRINGINEETELRKNELDAAQAENDRILKEIDGADAKLKDLNDELADRRVGMEKSSGAKRLFEQRISFLTTQIERSEKEIEENRAMMAQCDEEFIKTDAEYKAATKELDELSLKAENLSKRLLNLSEKLALGEELAQSSQKKIIESIESLSDFKMNKGAMGIERANLNEKLKELQTRVNELSAKRDGLFADKEKTDKRINELDRSVFDYKNRIAEKEDEVREGNERSAAIDNEIFRLNSLISTLIARDNFYRDMKENYEGYAPAVKLLMGEAKKNPVVKSRVKGVVAELIKSDKKFDVALETALGMGAQNVVTFDTEDAKFLIEYLKTHRLGRVTFLPVSSVKPRIKSAEVSAALKERGALGVANELVTYDAQFENVISNLLGNTLIVDTLANAKVIAEKYRFAFKMVTLDGDVFSTQGSMTGGSRKADAQGVLSSDRKIEENAEQLKAGRAKMDALKEEKSKTENARDKHFSELEMLNDAYNGARQELMVEREKQSGFEKSLSDLDREIENVSDLSEEVSARLAEIESNYRKVESGGEKLQLDRKAAAESADKHQAEYDELRKERDRISMESTEMQVAVTEKKAKISSLSQEMERLKTAGAEAKTSVFSLTESIEGAKNIIEELRLEEEKVALTKEEQEKVNALRADIENIENYKGDLRDKLGKNGETREALNAALNDLSERKHTEEIALAKIDSDLEYMGQSIAEDYGLNYDSALEFKQEGYDGAEGEKEINRLRRKRAALGAINATAIEDCKTLKERYEEMTAQKEDLEKAESDLKEAIDKIKGEMLTQFDEGFNKINENFQRIFKELFGGGRAMLEMDYSQVEDRLEAGVEIIAEPPGKKLQKLSLLSGGEKALTAIAILFSILRLRPMPFCVLDEIEAALDEANVDRFARYLKKFSEETQFIVITHRKPTMELADALFGVTMQEKGVSKMVSVKLSDVEKIENGANFQ
ncbi:MAG: chromosome segregation protein SMC [Clostridia bacterium]|nr:chromosome segregation protein SMC [Clostridia bacterium]